MSNCDMTPFGKWKDFYLKMHNTGGNIYPQESLIRIFKGTYISSSDIGKGKNYEGMKIIDIGFGSGNNLFFFGSLGMHLYGVEVHPDICRQATEKLRAMGYEADLRPGNNRNLPFPENMFDYLVSWDVIL